MIIGLTSRSAATGTRHFEPSEEILGRLNANGGTGVFVSPEPTCARFKVSVIYFVQKAVPQPLYVGANSNGSNERVCQEAD